MKAILFIFFLTLNFLSASQAQIIRRANFEVSEFDISANSFFNDNPKVSHIIIAYYDNIAQIADVYFRDQSSTTASEQYTLTFDGDVYLFNKKYKTFRLPNYRTAKLTYIQGVKTLNDSNIVCQLRITLRRDSLKHDFSFATVTGNTKHGFFPSQYRPTFKGDIPSLEKLLEHNFKQWRPNVMTDSVIIMTGTVDKKGKIGPLRLTEGPSSAYTDKVLNFMSKEATSWWPKFDGGGSREWPVRISVRVNKDGSIKVSIL